MDYLFYFDEEEERKKFVVEKFSYMIWKIKNLDENEVLNFMKLNKRLNCSKSWAIDYLNLCFCRFAPIV